MYKLYFLEKINDCFFFFFMPHSTHSLAPNVKCKISLLETFRKNFCKSLK